MTQTMTPSELADHCGDDLFPCTFVDTSGNVIAFDAERARRRLQSNMRFPGGHRMVELLGDRHLFEELAAHLRAQGYRWLGEGADIVEIQFD